LPPSLGLFIHIPWACSFTFVGPVFLNPDRVPAISLAASLLPDRVPAISLAASLLHYNPSRTRTYSILLANWPRLHTAKLWAYSKD